LTANVAGLVQICVRKNNNSHKAHAQRMKLLQKQQEQASKNVHKKVPSELTNSSDSYVGDGMGTAGTAATIAILRLLPRPVDNSQLSIRVKNHKHR
jgi:hypothetical protein